MRINETITDVNPVFTYSLKPYPLDTFENWTVTSIKSMRDFATVTVDRTQIPATITVTPKKIVDYEDVIQILLYNAEDQNCKRKMIEFIMNVTVSPELHT